MSRPTPPSAPSGIETKITTTTRACDASEYSPCSEEEYAHNMKGWFDRVDAMRSKVADSVRPFSYTVGENDFGEYTVNTDGPNKTVFTETDACNCCTGVCSTFEDPVQEGITLEELKESYKAEREAWISSQGFAELKKMLEELLVADKYSSTASGNAVAIDTCVAMGLGSFSGRRGEEARLRRMQQLVFFASVAEVISGHQPSSPPSLYAQEPDFNDLDRSLLSDLGITTVNHPTGFNKMTRNSLAFCPGAEQIVDLRTLIRDPKLYIGGKLETWTDKFGRLRSTYVSRWFSKSELRAYEAQEAQVANANGLSYEPKGDCQATDGGHTDKDEDEDEDDESLIIYDDCAKHNAEFVRKFMESGRRRYNCPRSWCNNIKGLGNINFLIWRDDRPVDVLN